MKTIDESSSGGITNVLKRGPHTPCHRPKAVVAAFERFLRKIEKEHEHEAEDGIRDGSSQLDKYLYG